MHIYEKEFHFVIERAMSLNKPARMVVAGAADADNILNAVFVAQEQGFCEPVLVGEEDKIRATLERLGLADRKYQICAIADGENVVQHAIDVINIGMGDVLVRGNTSTRDFLMPILHKANKMIRHNPISEVSLIKVPYYDKVLALSDVSVVINPSVEQRKLIIKNIVEVLNTLGVENPKVAVLSLVEKPSFHMRDTVEAQSIAKAHAEEPIAECEVVGPSPWDLIVSKEAARLKKFDCPYCGEFDAVLMPNVMAGNTVMKVLSMSSSVNSCGVLAGTSVPVAIASRSSDMEQVYLSLCVAAAMFKNKK